MGGFNCFEVCAPDPVGSLDSTTLEASIVGGRTGRLGFRG